VTVLVGVAQYSKQVCSDETLSHEPANDKPSGIEQLNGGVPAPPVPAPELTFLTAAKPKRNWRPLWIFALCLTLAAATLAAREYLDRRIPERGQLLVQAVDRDGQLQFQWDRSARLVLQARGARVEITDGP